jgi:hypothetical protein
MSSENEIYLEAEELLKNEVVDRHSFFQLKYFVVGKEPTMQAKMWRCLTELKTRKEAIDSINLEIEETKDTIELLNIEEKRLENINKYESNEKSWTQSEADEIEYHEEELKIKKRQIKRKKEGISKSLDNLYKKLKFTQEEAAFFIKSFKQLNQIEELKPFDDFESQKLYWNEKLSQEFDLKILLHRQPDVELVKTILALTDDLEVKKTTVRLLQNTQKAISDTGHASRGHNAEEMAENK